MGCRLSGKNWKVEEFSKEDTNIIIGAKRGSTFKQYIIFFKKLRILFGEKQKEDPLCPKINLLLDFLTELLDQGFSYQAVNSAKSTISSICQEKFTCDNAKLLKQFMKGAFEKRPFFPLYSSTWDVDKVFKVIEARDNFHVL